MKSNGLSVVTRMHVRFRRAEVRPGVAGLAQIVIFFLGSAIPSIALADVLTTGYGKITRIETGWYGEGIALHHSGNAIGGCSADPHEFGIEVNNSLFKELTALATTAFSTGSDVDLVVQSGDCIFGGRTKVISIRLKN
ncbi:hypothetical protein [Pseudoxanthomonas winnipegensis]|uniref:hypothetical protein n=1 Tax=Pseudoxanthomonas winnipegensis TaxID=2480810 RepID=UPI00103F726B|nr:hypothetical protein [Pseudoxanthomonas winnipegensis]TBV73264.1 hypothetical protein EYC45_12840 [Pseudoxanthomonas winnipegensis]